MADGPAIASSFAPGLLDSTYYGHLTESEASLTPECQSPRHKGDVTIEGQRKAGFCFGGTLTIQKKIIIKLFVKCCFFSVAHLNRLQRACVYS